MEPRESSQDARVRKIASRCSGTERFAWLQVGQRAVGGGFPRCRSGSHLGPAREVLALRRREHTLGGMVTIAPGGSKHSRTILVAEDDIGLRDLVAEILQSSGYQVVSADDGQQAIDYLASAEEVPDAVLLDLMMPVVNGWDCLRVMRSDDRLCGIPIVVMSEAEQGAAGADMFLRKPFRVDELLETIDHFARGGSNRFDRPGSP